MSSDIRDQLRKLGMVSDQQVEQADTQKKRRAPSQKKAAKSTSKASEASRGSGRRAVKSEKKIVWVSEELPPKQKVMELIAKNSRNVATAAEDYFFSDAAGAVRSVKITGRQKVLLAAGDLVVVKPQQNRDPYVLIPGEVAQKVAEIVPERIVLWHNAPDVKGVIPEAPVGDEKPDE